MTILEAAKLKCDELAAEFPDFEVVAVQGRNEDKQNTNLGVIMVLKNKNFTPAE